eukprot:UN26421
MYNQMPCRYSKMYGRLERSESYQSHISTSQKSTQVFKGRKQNRNRRRIKKKSLYNDITYSSSYFPNGYVNDVQYGYGNKEYFSKSVLNQNEDSLRRTCHRIGQGKRGVSRMEPVHYNSEALLSYVMSPR